MNRKRVGAALLVGLVLVIGVSAWLRVAALSPEELARRCAEARPQWQRYDEDIKALGAGPVAAWRGSPRSAQIGEGVIEVAFALEAPWDRYEAALPILLRLPDGTILHPVSSTLEGGIRTYVYTWQPPSQDVPVPWVELRFPHIERRLVLDGAGRWAQAPL